MTAARPVLSKDDCRASALLACDHPADFPAARPAGLVGAACAARRGDGRYGQRAADATAGRQEPHAGLGTAAAQSPVQPDRPQRRVRLGPVAPASGQRRVAAHPGPVAHDLPRRRLSGPCAVRRQSAGGRFQRRPRRGGATDPRGDGADAEPDVVRRHGDLRAAALANAARRKRAAAAGRQPGAICLHAPGDRTAHARRHLPAPGDAQRPQRAVAPLAIRSEQRTVRRRRRRADRHADPRVAGRGAGGAGGDVRRLARFRRARGADRLPRCGVGRRDRLGRNAATGPGAAARSGPVARQRRAGAPGHRVDRRRVRAVQPAAAGRLPPAAPPGRPGSAVPRTAEQSAAAPARARLQRACADRQLHQRGRPATARIPAARSAGAAAGPVADQRTGLARPASGAGDRRAAGNSRRTGGAEPAGLPRLSPGVLPDPHPRQRQHGRRAGQPVDRRNRSAPHHPRPAGAQRGSGRPGTPAHRATGQRHGAGRAGRPGQGRLRHPHQPRNPLAAQCGDRPVPPGPARLHRASAGRLPGQDSQVRRTPAGNRRRPARLQQAGCRPDAHRAGAVRPRAAGAERRRHDLGARRGQAVAGRRGDRPDGCPPSCAAIRCAWRRSSSTWPATR